MTVINENCPCKRVKCERHGDCPACREHHATVKNSPPACEKPDRKAARKERREKRKDNSTTIA